MDALSLLRGPTTGTLIPLQVAASVPLRNRRRSRSTLRPVQ